jgi:hypothetical protein
MRGRQPTGEIRTVLRLKIMNFCKLTLKPALKKSVKQPFVLSKPELNQDSTLNTLFLA